MAPTRRCPGANQRGINPNPHPPGHSWPERLEPEFAYAPTLVFFIRSGGHAAHARNMESGNTGQREEPIPKPNSLRQILVDPLSGRPLIMSRGNRKGLWLASQPKLRAIPLRPHDSLEPLGLWSVRDLAGPSPQRERSPVLKFGRNHAGLSPTQFLESHSHFAKVIIAGLPSFR